MTETYLALLDYSFNNTGFKLKQSTCKALHPKLKKWELREAFVVAILKNNLILPYTEVSNTEVQSCYVSRSKRDHRHALTLHGSFYDSHQGG